MAYEIQTWSNRPSTDTPVNAQRLNHMEQGIYDSYFASNISFDKSGCKIISKDNIQEALKELDATTNAINQNLSLIGTKYKTQNTITHANAWTVTDIGKLTVPKGIYAVELRVEASEAITATEVEIGIANHAWNAYHLNGAFNYAQSVTAVGEFDGDIIGHIFPAGNLDNINIYVTLEAYRIA